MEKRLKNRYTQNPNPHYLYCTIDRYMYMWRRREGSGAIHDAFFLSQSLTALNRNVEQMQLLQCYNLKKKIRIYIHY